MAKSKNETINVQGTTISITQINQDDYISLTDLAKYRNSKDPSQVISLWMRTYSTIEYLGLWETIYNADFKPHIYEGFKTESAKPSFWISPQQWIKETGGAVQPGESERRFHPPRTVAIRTSGDAQPNGHHTADLPVGQ